jgi:hypothetical protein
MQGEQQPRMAGAKLGSGLNLDGHQQILYWIPVEQFPPVF